MRIRSLFLCSAALVVSAPAIAADIYTPAEVHAPQPGFVSYFGDLEVAIGYSWLTGDEVGGAEADEYLFGSARARIGWNFGYGALAQFDLFGEITDVGTDHADSYVSGIGTLAHLAWRDPSRGLVGVFAGYGYVDRDNDDSDKVDALIVGLEGQAYFGNATLYGQVGYLDSDEDEDRAIRDAGFVRVVGRYFVTPDTRLEAGLAAAFGIMDGDEDDVWLANWHVGAEHRFARTAWSAFVGYEGLVVNQPDENDEIFEHSVKAGVRYAFGAGSDSLLSQDRNGATLDAPSFMRWVAISGGPME